MVLAGTAIFSATSTAVSAAAPWGPSDVPISHVVILMMENHAFDNYFGTYCPTAGPYCSAVVTGEPPGLCVPNVPQGGEPQLTPAVVVEAVSSDEEADVFESNEVSSTVVINETFTGSTIGNFSAVAGPMLTVYQSLSESSLKVTAITHIDALPKGSMMIQSVTVDWGGTLLSYNYAGDNKTGSFGPFLTHAFPKGGNYTVNATVLATDGATRYEAAGPVYNVSLTGPQVACTKPYELNESEMFHKDLPHNYPNTVGSLDGGLMDGFYKYEYATTGPFGYYNSSTIPIYWDMAEEYALGDYFFSSAQSYSLPNHWFLVAGSAPAESVLQNSPVRATAQYKHTYLNESNATYTVEDMLNATPSVSWKYYDWNLPSYQKAINAGWTTYGDSAYDYWNPLAAKAESYTADYASHFVSRDTFFTDAEAGNLPDVSYLIPYPTFSDHAGTSNISAGEAFIAQAVDSVESGPDWASTAIFISWDDYGGWYDGIAPPLPVGSTGGKISDTNVSADLSMRVPLIVISPYTPEGKVVSSLGYFESLLHFIEWRFSLKTAWGADCITTRDCDAPLPFGYFDFNMTPRAPMLFPTNWENATYPMALQGSAAVACPNDCAIEPDRWNTDAAESNVNYTEDHVD
ncbi:MAG: alkaline phosphatase family protein [Thermoplasmata archaeon]